MKSGSRLKVLTKLKIKSDCVEEPVGDEIWDCAGSPASTLESTLSSSLSASRKLIKSIYQRC